MAKAINFKVLLVRTNEIASKPTKPKIKNIRAILEFLNTSPNKTITPANAKDNLFWIMIDFKKLPPITIFNLDRKAIKFQILKLEIGKYQDFSRRINMQFQEKDIKKCYAICSRNFMVKGLLRENG